ncbi:MAG TPA: hypothetical protein VEL79_07100, partial [Vicinamibacterales bacterium]|nr:hypothetical protein [Vicinamibacterales bacterium]
MARSLFMRAPSLNAIQDQRPRRDGYVADVDRGLQQTAGLGDSMTGPVMDLDDRIARSDAGPDG